MKPFIIVPYQKEAIQGVHIPDYRGLGFAAWSSPSPEGFSEDAQLRPNALYFADREDHAERIAYNLTQKWPQWNWLIARTTGLYDMPRPANLRPEFKVFSEKGVLP